jgi:hypothetical protein
MIFQFFEIFVLYEIVFNVSILNFYFKHLICLVINTFINWQAFNIIGFDLVAYPIYLVKKTNRT